MCSAGTLVSRSHRKDVGEMPALSGAFLLLPLLCETDAGDLGGQGDRRPQGSIGRGTDREDWHEWLF